MLLQSKLGASRSSPSSRIARMPGRISGDTTNSVPHSVHVGALLRCQVRVGWAFGLHLAVGLSKVTWRVDGWDGESGSHFVHRQEGRFGQLICPSSPQLSHPIGAGGDGCRAAEGREAPLRRWRRRRKCFHLLEPAGWPHLAVRRM